MTRRACSVDDAIHTIRAYTLHKGWSVYKLAKESGLTKETLRDIHRRSWNPRSDTLRILYALVPEDFDPETAKPAPPVVDRRRTPTPRQEIRNG